MNEANHTIVHLMRRGGVDFVEGVAERLEELGGWSWWKKVGHWVWYGWW